MISRTNGGISASQSDDVFVRDDKFDTKNCAAAEDLMRAVRFHEMLELELPTVDSPHDIFEILHPLLTRSMRIDWDGIVPFSQSWRLTTQAITLLIEAVDFTSDWNSRNLKQNIDNLLPIASNSQISFDRLLFQCILFSEQRLPLYESLCFLGKNACVDRLKFVHDNIIQMNMIG
jgi:hypothetical protein